MSSFDPFDEAAAELGCGADELEGTFPPGFVNAVRNTPTFKWHQPKVDPFDDAEFYENGSVVTITLGDNSVTVDAEGERRYTTTSGDSIDDAVRAPAEFRKRFPDGKLPEDGTDWVIDANGWFDLYALDGEHLDHLTYSLREAVGDAVDYLRTYA